MAYFWRKVSPIGLEARCLSHNLLQVIKKILIYPCFWGSVSEKKVSFTGAFSLFSGVGWCAVVAFPLGRLLAGVGLGLPWVFPVLGVVVWVLVSPWAWVLGLVLAWVLVGLWWWACFPSIKFEKWGAWKSIWPRGYRGSSIFWHYPPPISCRGWRGWAVAWAGVIRAILSGFR